jgi:phosphoesterase RecJ-like protein
VTRPTGQLHQKRAEATLSDLVGPILAAKNILALSHVNPDGDAVGALLGLGHLLDALPEQRKVTLACQDPAPESLRFIEGLERIVTALPPDLQPDLIISLDASDPARLGKIFADLAYSSGQGSQADSIRRPASQPLLLVIDHHITNLRFGDLNCVAPIVASTSQLIVSLGDVLGVPLPPASATPLLVGLVTDTLGFRTANVTASELACAERLMRAGADLADITQRTLATRPLKFMRLWGMAFTNAKLDDAVLWAEVTKEMRLAAGINGDDDGGLVGQLIIAEEAHVAAVFNELADGQIEVDFRARPGHDVASVALSLGGGGHPQASGCTLPGPMNDVKSQVLPLLQQASRSAQDRPHHKDAEDPRSNEKQRTWRGFGP